MIIMSDETYQQTGAEFEETPSFDSEELGDEEDDQEGEGEGEEDEGVA